MKMNRLGFLSLLALVGILGLTSDNKALLGFFSFAYYFRYFFVTPDELFVQNVRRAASIGFFAGVASTGIALALYMLFPSFISSKVALSACYVVSMLSFTLVLTQLEIKETRGC